MEFPELQVGSDDWLIPGKEISSPKLIRQTARFNVYKADWFGDVLVYEPIVAQHTRESTLDKNHTPTMNQVTNHSNNMNQQLKKVATLNPEELSSRLTGLRLEVCLDDTRWTSSEIIMDNQGLDSPRSVSSQTSYMDTESLNSGGSGADSAYSSISSTPQHHTKTFKSKFEFPNLNKLSRSLSSSLTSMSSSLTDISTLSSYTNSNNCTDNIAVNLEDKIRQNSNDLLHHPQMYNNKQHEDKSNRNNNNSPHVILNKDSYRIFNYNQCLKKLNKPPVMNLENNCNINQNHNNNNSDTHDCECNSDTRKSNWSELNELRLIAHESFMLFMGASFDFNNNTSASTSLVMQMNSLKAESLYNLLHASKFTNSSTKRFLTFNAPRYQCTSFSLEAKLNICQQVTNAMTYLHDKNIVHGKLTSVNIYIQPKNVVKISLIDDAQTALASNTTLDSITQSSDSIKFDLPSLTYLSPELIKTIKTGVQSDENFKTDLIVDTNFLTKMSDIFSFGTLLYELFEEEFPFNPGFGTSSTLLINKLSLGEIGCSNLKRTGRCPKGIEQIIERCWSMNPKDRPVFKQLAFAWDFDNKF